MKFQPLKKRMSEPDETDEYLMQLARNRGKRDKRAILAELARRIREIEARWSGLDQVPAMELRALNRERARIGWSELFRKGGSKMEGQQYSLITQDQMKQVALIDQVAQASQREIIAADKARQPMAKAMILANATNQIRELLDPLMPALMKLRGTPLGFSTDKDILKKDEHDYPLQVIRDGLTVGLLKGCLPVDNETNIIAGKFYATKTALKRLIRDWPGLTNLRIEIGVPQNMTSGAGALVPVLATWKQDGNLETIDCRRNVDNDNRIPIRVNAGMGVDAILGKAKSKIYRLIYERLTGSDLAIVEDAGEADPESMIDGEVIQSSESPASSHHSHGDSPRSTTPPADSIPPSAIQSPPVVSVPVASKPLGTESQATPDRTTLLSPSDLAGSYQQYLERLASCSLIREATECFEGYFRMNRYAWSKTDEYNGLRDLERRHDQIRKTRGGKGTEKQAELV